MKTYLKDCCTYECFHFTIFVFQALWVEFSVVNWWNYKNTIQWEKIYLVEEWITRLVDCSFVSHTQKWEGLKFVTIRIQIQIQQFYICISNSNRFFPKISQFVVQINFFWIFRFVLYFFWICNHSKTI